MGSIQDGVAAAEPEPEHALYRSSDQSSVQMSGDDSNNRAGVGIGVGIGVDKVEGDSFLDYCSSRRSGSRFHNTGSATYSSRHKQDSDPATHNPLAGIPATHSESMHWE